MAQINDKFSKLADDVFRREYSQLEVWVRDTIPLPDKLNELLNVTDRKIDEDKIERIFKDQSYFLNDKPIIGMYGKHIGFTDYSSILNTFKHFGHEIKKLNLKLIRTNQFMQNWLDIWSVNTAPNHWLPLNFWLILAKC